MGGGGGCGRGGWRLAGGRRRRLWPGWRGVSPAGDGCGFVCVCVCVCVFGVSCVACRVWVVWVWCLVWVGVWGFVCRTCVCVTGVSLGCFGVWG
nr:MAG TPA: hypothetical protein [Caudoviricetes sp.]